MGSSPPARSATAAARPSQAGQGVPARAGQARFVVRIGAGLPRTERPRRCGSSPLSFVGGGSPGVSVGRGRRAMARQVRS